MAVDEFGTAVGAELMVRRAAAGIARVLHEVEPVHAQAACLIHVGAQGRRAGRQRGLSPASRAAISSDGFLPTPE